MKHTTESQRIDVEMPVAGMTCQACASSIESAVRGIDGVLRAEASFGARSLSVSIDSERVTRADISSRISAVLAPLGYRIPVSGGATASLADDLQFARDSDVSERRRVRRELAAAFVLGLATWAALHFGWPSWIALALAGGVVFGACNRIVLTGMRALLRRAPDMNTLVGLGICAAWFTVSISLVAPNVIHHVDHYLLDAVLIAFFVLLGRELEARARTSAGDAVAALMTLAPPTARVLRRGVEVEIPLAEVARGSIVIVKPGERIPVDGIVIEGRTSVDESLLTGESAARERSIGEVVHGGTLNGNGTISIEARGIGADSALGRIAEAVRRARGTKAPIQRLADRVSAIFATLVLAIAIATFGGWLVFAGDASAALSHTIAVLVISCPCALGLATPAAILAATSSGARAGLVFRDAEALERLARVDTVAFDKTGTLTLGRPTLATIRLAPTTVADTALTHSSGSIESDPRSRFPDPIAHVTSDERAPAVVAAENRVLELAAAVEAKSEQPLARGIVAAARARDLPSRPVREFRALPGIGVEGRVDGRVVWIGSPRGALERGADPSTILRLVEPLESRGESPVLVLVDGVPEAAFGLVDEPRRTSAAAVRSLREQGLQVLVLSGDRSAAVERLRSTLAIDRAASELSPEAKVRELSTLEAAGHRVAMVGDGINDAPALAAAFTSLAFGGGADVAVHTAGTTIVRDDPAAVPAALRLARATLRTIRQNLAWAFAYNVFAIPIATGAFDRVLGGALPVGLAGLAMSFSSLAVVLNSLRLRKNC